jgi:16S rRNA (uracil1498-N3)-methyltransferase
MARKYRFFTHHIVKDSLPANPDRPLRLYENLEPEIFFQLTRVLRVRSGDHIVLIPAFQNKPYFEFLYEVENTDKKEIVLRFINKLENHNETAANLELILCLPNKPDKLDFILQKAVELGVSRIILVEGDFSQMKHGLRIERLQKIITEAAEQSERAIIPEIVAAGSLREYLKSNPGNIFIALERGNLKKLPEILKSGNSAGIYGFLIGPEGGFSEEEKLLFDTLRLTTFSLGKRILRMETAAVLTLGMASMIFED